MPDVNSDGTTKEPVNTDTGVATPNVPGPEATPVQPEAAPVVEPAAEEPKQEEQASPEEPVNGAAPEEPAQSE